MYWKQNIPLTMRNLDMIAEDAEDRDRWKTTIRRKVKGDFIFARKISVLKKILH